MSSLLALPLLWAQTGGAGPAVQNLPAWLRNALVWLFLYGDPRLSPGGLLGGWLTWIKAISLLCLVAWVGSWLVTAIKERYLARGGWLDFAALGALLLIPITMLIRTLQAAKQIPDLALGTLPVTTLFAYVILVVLTLWIEIGIWRTIRRFGRGTDILVLVGMHLALALGLAVGILVQQAGILPTYVPNQKATWSEGLIYGVGLGATYMGYVILLRILGLLGRELIAVRGRRLYAIAKLTIQEANRRMWAPWVVLAVFGLILAFTHWFLHPASCRRDGAAIRGHADPALLAAVDSDGHAAHPAFAPHRHPESDDLHGGHQAGSRLELVWGRMLGFMTLVTVLIAVFGGISLDYLSRTVGGTITSTEAAAVKAKKENRDRDFAQLMEQANQLRSRMAARVPVKGSLSFLDSRGTPHAMGIDVGHGAVHEGASQPHRGGDSRDRHLEFWRGHRPVLAGFPTLACSTGGFPLGTSLLPGRSRPCSTARSKPRSQIVTEQKKKTQPNLSAAEVARLDKSIQQNTAEAERIKTEYEALKKRADDLVAQAAAAEAAGNAEQGKSLRKQSPGPPLRPDRRRDDLQRLPDHEGEARRAGARRDAGHQSPHRKRLHGRSSRSGNTTRTSSLISPELLAGSMGDLKIEVRCISPTQYLGMAESDLYLLSSNRELRHQLHEGALRRLAPGHGAHRHRRVRGHLPELARGTADHDRLLRRRPAALQLPARFHAPGCAGRRARSSR